jgi:hypothetical protein
MGEFDELKKKVFDEVVRTSRGVVLREQVRADLRQMVTERLSSGDISSEDDVKSFIRAMKSGIEILENVPFESWLLIIGARE